MKNTLILIAVLYSANLVAQDTTQKQDKEQVSFSGYAEAYYSYDFNKPADNYRPGFLYSHNRSNEFNIKHGLYKSSLFGRKGAR